MRYVCSACGFVYDEEAMGAPFRALPQSWHCPMCAATRGDYRREGAADEPAVLPDPYYGSTTRENLLKLLADQAGNSGALRSAAQAARQEGLPAAAQVLSELADYEAAHADVLRRALCRVGTTAENLSAAREALSARLADYASLVRTAEIEGFGEMAERLHAMQEAEQQMLARLETLQRRVEAGLYVSDAPETWHCRACGWQTQSRQAPDVCPLCGSGRTAFERD